MKKVLAFAVIASAMLAGCSKEETTSVPALAKGELGVSATVQGPVTTRSLITGFETGNQVAVFVTGTGYTPMVAKYTYNGTTPWTSPASETEKIFLFNETATVYGFCPADAVVSGTLTNDDQNTVAVTFTYPETSFTAAGQTDYLYATGPQSGGVYPLATASNNTSAGENEVDLVMHHAAAKLSFVINKDDSYSGTGALSSVSLAKTGGFYAGSGLMQVKDGVFVSVPSADQISFTGSATINDYNATPSTVVSALGLVCPVADASGITLEVTIDGKAMSVALPADAPANLWEQGKNYTYTITVKGTELIVNTVSVLDWIEVTGGNAEVN